MRFTRLWRALLLCPLLSLPFISAPVRAPSGTNWLPTERTRRFEFPPKIFYNVSTLKSAPWGAQWESVHSAVRQWELFSTLPAPGAVHKPPLGKTRYKTFVFGSQTSPRVFTFWGAVLSSVFWDLLSLRSLWGSSFCVVSKAVPETLPLWCPRIKTQAPPRPCHHLRNVCGTLQSLIVIIVHFRKDWGQWLWPLESV